MTGGAGFETSTIRPTFCFSAYILFFYLLHFTCFTLVIQFYYHLAQVTKSYIHIVKNCSGYHFNTVDAGKCNKCRLNRMSCR